MANEANLEKGKATQFRAGAEQAKIAQQGGIASGEARRRKADMRRAMEDMLNSEFTDKKTGKKISGLDMITASMLKIAGNPNNKSAVAAYKAIAEITGQQEAAKGDDIDDDTRAAVAELLKNANANGQGKRNKDIE